MASFGALPWQLDPLGWDEAGEKVAEAEDLYARNLAAIDALLRSPRHLVTACDLFLESAANLAGVGPEDSDFFFMTLRHSVMECGGSKGSVDRLREHLQSPSLKILVVGKEADRTAATAALGGPQDLCGLGSLLSIMKLQQLPANIVSLTPCAFVFALRNDRDMERLLSDAKEAYDKLSNRRPNCGCNLLVDEDSFLFVFPHWNQVRKFDHVLSEIRSRFPGAKVNKNVFFLRSGTDIEGSLDLENAVLSLVPRALQADHEAAFFWLQEVRDELQKRLDHKIRAVRDVYGEAEHWWRTLCCWIGEEAGEGEAIEKTLRQMRALHQEVRDSFREEVTRFSLEFLRFLRSFVGLEELGRFSEEDAPNCDMFGNVLRVVLTFILDRLKIVFKAWNASSSQGPSKLQQLRWRLNKKCRDTFSMVQHLLPKVAGRSSIQETFRDVETSDCEPSFHFVSDLAFRRMEKIMPNTCSSIQAGFSLANLRYPFPVLHFVSNVVGPEMRRSYLSDKSHFIRKRLKTVVNEVIDSSFLEKDVEQMISLSASEKSVDLLFAESNSRMPTQINDIIKTKHCRKSQFETLQHLVDFVHVIQDHLSFHFFEHIKHYEFNLASSDLQSGTFPATLLNRNFEESLVAWPTIGIRRQARLIHLREAAWQELCKFHPRNVLLFFGCLKVHEEVFFVSESVAGSLKDHLQSTATLLMRRCERERQVRSVGTQIASGMKFVHDARLVVHELCPGSILYRRKGDTLEIKLFCFGHETDVSTEPFLKVSNEYDADFMDYVSPETRSWNVCTPSSNVYSCGLILSDLFCGIAFHAARETKSGIVARIADLPEFLENLIMLCTAFEPTHRPTADGVITALSQ